MNAPYIDPDRARVSRRAFRAVVAVGRTADRYDPREALFWAALDAHKGAIRPEYVQRGGRLVLAGEYVDLPKHLRPRSAQYGADCLAQYVRDRGFDATTSDVLAFFSANPRRPQPARAEAELARTLRSLGAKVTQNDAAVLLLQSDMGALQCLAATPEQERTKKANRRAKKRLAGDCASCTVNPVKPGLHLVRGVMVPYTNCEDCIEKSKARVAAWRAAQRR